MVALTIVLSPAARTASASTSRTRSREGRKRATSTSRYAPTSASRVLPIVMPSTVSGGGLPVSAFASKAPAATPGHMRRPQTTMAASAIPVGGQTAVMLSFSNASSSPSLAVAK